MTDPAKDAERLALLERAKSIYHEACVMPKHVTVEVIADHLAAEIARPTQERDEAREQAAHLQRGFESVEKQCRERGRELREARRSVEELQKTVDLLQSDETWILHQAQPTTDDVERARGLYCSLVFTMSDEAADTKKIVAALTAARHEERQSALKVVGKLQELVVNVRHWIAHGCSETAVKALDEAMTDAWAATGYKDLLRDAALADAEPGR